MFSNTMLILFLLISRSLLYFNRFSPSSDLVVTNIFFNPYLNCLLTLFSVSYHGEMFAFLWPNVFIFSFMTPEFYCASKGLFNCKTIK